jgi:hypothetical protein
MEKFRKMWAVTAGGADISQIDYWVLELASENGVFCMLLRKENLSLWNFESFALALTMFYSHE